MKAMVAWWDLTDSEESPDTLRDFVRDEEKYWRDIPGLLLKVWISDPSSGRWGAVLVWESEEAARSAVLPRSPAGAIGHPVDFRAWFDVEAAVGPGMALPFLADFGAAEGSPAAPGPTRRPVNRRE
ncbi:hypothetical protein H3147_04590 [Streptomyces sp. OF8]|uniref:YdhR family protein n=2 Tax=Streptomyces alkaliterrae TaxID=2213162 RepID=A0A5P0YLN2_9ACTN|nr:hypothetical protein [Streptomyces alkaliterrae]MBB1258107.1 hypothetical protein [Streptomyces alkaliterrae]MQS00537.1 hypothetical protein [Streptomyces alkaliterrae]